MGKKKLRIKAFAKINLSLQVLAKRPDGYHQIRTLFQSIDLADVLTLEILSGKEESKNRITISCESPMSIPKEDNLVYKAGKQILKNKSAKVKIRVEKNIPVGAGLGGGSSDAAATLVGLNELLKLGKSKDELRKMAQPLGADVPYFLEGGLCLGRGRGEILTPQSFKFEDFIFLLIKPPFSLCTKKVYKRWDKMNKEAKLAGDRSKRKFPSNLKRENIEDIAGINDLTTPALKLCPRLCEYEKYLRNSESAFWGMSGSGPTFYGAFRKENSAKIRGVKGKIAKELEAETYVVRPTGAGYQICLDYQ